MPARAHAGLDGGSKYLEQEGAPTPKGRRTRARILESARRSLETNGYFDATVTDITSGSGVALGTFYRYFLNKEEAFMVLLEQLVGELYDATGGSWNDDDPLGSIEEATRRYLVAYQTNRQLIAALQQMAAAVPACAATWTDLRARTHARMARRLRDDRGLDVQLAVSALAGMVEQYAYRWYVEAPLAGQRSPSLNRSVATLSRIWFQVLYQNQEAG